MSFTGSFRLGQSVLYELSVSSSQAVLGDSLKKRGFADFVYFVIEYYATLWFIHVAIDVGWRKLDHIELWIGIDYK